MTTPRYIPEGATEITRDGIDAVAYTYEANGKPLAIYYHGKASKHDGHYSYPAGMGKTAEERRSEAIERHFAGQKAHQDAKAARKAERKAELKTAPPSKAQTVRAELKANGINSRQVSVRTDNYSMGSSIDVTIRDADIDPEQVVPIAHKVERIDRCEITGDILNGGNTYVHVQYTEDAKAERCAELAAQITELMPTLEAGSNSLLPIGDTEYSLGAGDWDGMYTIWSDHFIQQGTTAMELAAAITCNCRQQAA